MPQQQNLAIPIAIVAAGALIAGALYFTSDTTSPADNGNGATAKDIPAVKSDEHILGDPDAPIKIVEYTDLECPFCKQFHGTMKTVIDEYGASGEVAWVLRNFPLQQIHPNAPALASAAECVADVGGNDTYWKFLDSVFTQAPINTFFDMKKLDATVTGVGVNLEAFKTCYSSGEFRDKISQEFNDAVASGGGGTPHNIVVLDKKLSAAAKTDLEKLQASLPPGSISIFESGKMIGMTGSQPLATVKAIIEILLK